MIGTEDLAYFNRHLSRLLKAGLPLEKSLKELSAAFRGELGRTAAAMEGEMEKGLSLEEVLETYEDILPPLYIAMCRAGIAADNLPEVLEYYSTYSLKMERFRRQFRVMSVYPILVLVCSIAAGITVALMASGLYTEITGNVAEKGWLFFPSGGFFWVVNILVVALITVLIAGTRSPLFRGHGFLWAFPPTRYLKLHALAAMIVNLLDSGISEGEVSEVLREFVTDPVIRDYLKNVNQRLDAGEDLTAALTVAMPAEFPRMWYWALRHHSRFGGLVGAFRRLAETCARRAETQIRFWLGLMLPLLTLICGILVFFEILFIFSRFIPLFDIVNQGLF